MVDSTVKKRVLMIDNYDSFTWNIYQYLCQSRFCEKVDVYRNDEVTVDQVEHDIKPDIIFISPGPGHPSTDAGVSRALIDHFKGKLPIFGVCMGQQCIFEVFGGQVEYAGEIVHGKATAIKHDGKGMFQNVPQSVAVTRYHSLAGSLKSLPDCLEITATTETDPLVIMGVRHKKYTIEGVQFHPESILTESGRIMIDNLLQVSGATWDECGPEATKTAQKENILTRIYRQRESDYQSIESLPGKSYADLLLTYSLLVAPELIDFYERMMATTKANKNVILAEFKRASPSKGDINIKAHPGKQALTYARSGCSAISVLTEPNWFKGSLDDLSLIRRAIDTIKSVEGYKRPAVLRKEFIFSKYQILEARLAGADTVLLIVKMLDNSELLEDLYKFSWELGMVPLVEVNDNAELKVALALSHNNRKEPLVIGVNNRNLTTFEVDLGTTTSLVDMAKNSGREGPVLVLALSGISTTADVSKYKSESVDGFLIGESLMRAEEAGKADSFLQELMEA